MRMGPFACPGSSGRWLGVPALCSLLAGYGPGPSLQHCCPACGPHAWSARQSWHIG
ncbi:unnamed protein product [Symbiodinium pilosum]|uniref:Uncharacterized protein n=1 Tax=Symbiodinium pilosum TaxID=2952 RepID=A0A812VRM7_SYMPI|nr:unnamed protein product [Symbiodinium pilosum]